MAKHYWHGETLLHVVASDIRRVGHVSEVEHGWWRCPFCADRVKPVPVVLGEELADVTLEPEKEP